MNIFKKTGLFVSFCLISVLSFSQTPVNTASPQTDMLNSDGKIYVVVAAVLIILIGLFIYLIYIDRKISKLEKEIK